MQSGYFDTAIEEEREVKRRTILRNDKVPGAKRADRYNKEIAWGQKAHKLTFQDQIQHKSLSQTFQVESYKEYNRAPIEQGTSCLLF